MKVEGTNICVKEIRAEGIEATISEKPITVGNKALSIKCKEFHVNIEEDEDGCIVMINYTIHTPETKVLTNPPFQNHDHTGGMVLYIPKGGIIEGKNEANLEIGDDQGRLCLNVTRHRIFTDKSWKVDLNGERKVADITEKRKR